MPAISEKYRILAQKSLDSEQAVRFYLGKMASFVTFRRKTPGKIL